MGATGSGRQGTRGRQGSTRSVATAVSVVGVLLVASLIAACGGDDSSSSTTAAPSDATTTTGNPTAAPSDATTTTESPYGEALQVDPPGPDEVVLTVTGPSGTQTYTMDQLREAATTTISVDEPFVKQRIEFSGVPMAQLFEPAGIAGAAVVDTIALNDYAFDAPANVFTDSDAIIAVKQAGGDIPIDKGGPIRIVFPDGTPGATNLDAWNWSLERIEAA